MKTTLEPISLAESKRLNELEAVIKRNEGAMLETAEALTEIRDNRLYRAEYGTFKAYCEERLGICRARGYQLINFAETVKMSTTVDTAPKTERSARAIRAAAKVPLEVASEPTSAYEEPPRVQSYEVPRPALRGVDVSKLDYEPAVKISETAAKACEVGDLNISNWIEVVEDIRNGTATAKEIQKMVEQSANACRWMLAAAAELKG